RLLLSTGFFRSRLTRRPCWLPVGCRLFVRGRRLLPCLLRAGQAPCWLLDIAGKFLPGGARRLRNNPSCWVGPVPSFRRFWWRAARCDSLSGVAPSRPSIDSLDSAVREHPGSGSGAPREEKPE